LRLCGLALLGFLIGCESKRPEHPGENLLRSEGQALNLPADPDALASALGAPRDSLLAAGQERYANQAYDSARAIWNVELNRAVSHADKKGEARVRMWLGILAWKMGDYKTAREKGEEALRLKRALGMDDELSRSFNALGLVAWNEGRHLEALSLYDSAVASARRNHDLRGVARATANIPLVKVELGRFDEARSDFDRAIQANAVAKDNRTQANLLANMGMLEIRLGNPAKGIEYINNSRTLYDADDKAGQSNALGQLATAWGAMGQLQRAIAAGDSAVQLAQSEGLQQEAASDLEVLADLQMQAGNPRLALATLHSADSIDAALGLRVERGTNLRRSSVVLADLGETMPAMDVARQALTEHRAVSALSEEMLDRLQLASILSGSNFAGALAQLDSAASEAKSTGNPAAINEVLVTYAVASIKSGQPQIALNKLSLVPKPTASSDWRVADLKSVALLKLRRSAEALKESRVAVSLIEKERSSLGVGSLRSGYLANRISPFSHKVESELAAGDTAAAFATAAQVPGRSLAERLGGLDDRGTRLSLVARNEKLLTRATELERRISEAREQKARSGQVDALEIELSHVRTQYEEKLARQAPLPRFGLLGGSIPSLSQVQALLNQGDALVLYLSGEDRLDAFFVTAHTITHRAAPIGDRSLYDKVRFARDAIQRSTESALALKSLGELNDILLMPFDRELSGVSRLIVVPHGPLGALPFAALKNRRTGRYLVEDKVVAYAPTVAALAIAPSSRIANVAIDVFVPIPDQLPATRGEAAAVGKLMRRSKLYFGRSSSKTLVRSAFLRGDIVHIASHGQHNSQNPLFSDIVVGGSQSSDDAVSKLTVQDVMTLSTTSPLVFLSGCETGLNMSNTAFAFQSDEGSLSQAFLFAGASSVIATLWPVEDSEAATIAADFYQSFSAGQNSASALAAAQRKAIGRKRGLNWAAYTVTATGTAKRR
jgi:CHAT domain-containing protein/tetratricopeptide (TPR) repeat protein